jgi:hypothetical protein
VEIGTAQTPLTAWIKLGRCKEGGEASADPKCHSSHYFVKLYDEFEVVKSPPSNSFTQRSTLEIKD